LGEAAAALGWFFTRSSAAYAVYEVPNPSPTAARRLGLLQEMRLIPAVHREMMLAAIAYAVQQCPNSDDAILVLRLVITAKVHLNLHENK